MLLQAVLFDLDGTMIDSEGFYVKIWQEVLGGYGLRIDGYRLLSSLGGKTDIQAYDVLKTEFGFAGEKDELLSLIHQEVARRLQYERVELMPGVQELIDYLSARQIRMAVVTSSKKAITEQHLGPHGLLQQFEFLVTRENVARTKPAPDPYHTAMTQLGLQASACLALEDSPTGMTAAYAAGIPVVGVQPHASIRELLPPDSQVFHDLFEVREYIQNLYFGPDSTFHKNKIPQK